MLFHFDSSSVIVDNKKSKSKEKHVAKAILEHQTSLYLTKLFFTVVFTMFRLESYCISASRLLLSGKPAVKFSR